MREVAFWVLASSTYSGDDTETTCRISSPVWWELKDKPVGTIVWVGGIQYKKLSEGSDYALR